MINAIISYARSGNYNHIVSHHIHIHDIASHIIAICIYTYRQCRLFPESRGSEGTKFALSFSPSQYDSDHAELIINARQTTEVTISMSDNTEVVTVAGNWSLHYDFEYEMRTVDGVENKGELKFTLLHIPYFKVRDQNIIQFPFNSIIIN